MERDFIVSTNEWVYVALERSSGISQLQSSKIHSPQASCERSGGELNAWLTFPIRREAKRNREQLERNVFFFFWKRGSSVNSIVFAFAISLCFIAKFSMVSHFSNEPWQLVPFREILPFCPKNINIGRRFELRPHNSWQVFGAERACKILSLCHWILNNNRKKSQMHNKIVHRVANKLCNLS